MLGSRLENTQVCALGGSQRRPVVAVGFKSDASHADMGRRRCLPICLGQSDRDSWGFAHTTTGPAMNQTEAIQWALGPYRLTSTQRGALLRRQRQLCFEAMTTAERGVELRRLSANGTLGVAVAR